MLHPVVSNWCSAQAQANQRADDDKRDGEGDHDFLIWEDRGAGPVAGYYEESDEEHAGPAETLLAGRGAHEASSSEAADSSDEDEGAPAGEESEDDDPEGDGIGPGEAPDLADGEEPAGRGVQLWEDRPAARQVGHFLHIPLLCMRHALLQ